MRYNTTKKKFREDTKRWKYIPLYLTCYLQSDPIVLFEHLKKDYSFLLYSPKAIHHSRYSILAINPKKKIVSNNGRVTIDGKYSPEKIFQVLKRVLNEYSTKKTPLPFCGGLVGYVGYEAASELEELPKIKKDNLNLPDVFFGIYESAILIDNKEKKMHIVSIGKNYENCKQEIVTLLFLIKGVINKNKEEKLKIKSTNKRAIVSSVLTTKQYINIINKIKNYIINGDTYQINFSHRFFGLTEKPSFEIFKDLMKINPSPYSAYASLGSFEIVSCSPELFMKKEGATIETHPIKGTRPLGKTKSEWEQHTKGLLNSTKERSEHDMIIDLERNDLGKVCKIGSVKVTNAHRIERYSHVIHMVSTVRGTLCKEKDAIDAFCALFPGGSITGCPKIRSMEIIHQLEQTIRGPYTGCLGYFSFDGDAQFNIMIRTIIIKNKKAHFNVGGGIVIDSNPKREYKETLDKAQALMESLS